MDRDQQLRNLRDFLLVYNKMTEICFQRCTSNLNYRTLTMDEERCLDSCAGKLIRSNHRLMGAYLQVMPGIVQRRVSEYETKAKEMAQASEAFLIRVPLSLLRAPSFQDRVIQTHPLTVPSRALVYSLCGDT